MPTDNIDRSPVAHNQTLDSTSRRAKVASQAGRQNMRSLCIGIGSRNYSYRRVSYGLPVPEVAYKKVLYFPWKMITRDVRRINTFRAPLARVDAFHLWNGISFGSKPFLSSFEADLPRYCGLPRDRLYQRCLDAIHSSTCRQLLALSQFALRTFMIRNQGCMDTATIAKKVRVFYGAIERPAHEVADDKHLHGPFTMTIVGHDFFRKGGVGVLRAFQKLRKNIPDLRLRIASRLNIGDYVTHAQESDAVDVRKILEQQEGIEWRESISNAEVMQWFRESHVALMPTLDDTFGWSALEPMAVGVPVIATNVCAMPEIIGNDRGVQIELPTSAEGRWAGMELPKRSKQRHEALDEAYETLAAGICRAAERLYTDRDLLRRLGENARRHVDENHCPRTQGERLRALYDELLN